MTADEWLKSNNKAPWECGNFWYWASYVYYHGKIFTEDEIDEEDKGYTLPVEIWNHLQEKTTYPYVKLYLTQEDALADFHQAYEKVNND